MSEDLDSDKEVKEKYTMEEDNSGMKVLVSVSHKLTFKMTIKEKSLAADSAYLETSEIIFKETKFKKNTLHLNMKKLEAII
jgi:hypothetical protein